MAQPSAPSYSFVFYIGALLLFMASILAATAGGAIGYSHLTANYINRHPDGWTLLLFGGLVTIFACNAAACVGMRLVLRRMLSA